MSKFIKEAKTTKEFQQLCASYSHRVASLRSGGAHRKLPAEQRRTTRTKRLRKKKKKTKTTSSASSRKKVAAAQPGTGKGEMASVPSAEQEVEAAEEEISTPYYKDYSSSSSSQQHQFQDIILHSLDTCYSVRNTGDSVRSTLKNILGNTFSCSICKHAFSINEVQLKVMQCPFCSAHYHRKDKCPLENISFADKEEVGVLKTASVNWAPEYAETVCKSVCRQGYSCYICVNYFERMRS